MAKVVNDLVTLNKFHKYFKDLDFSYWQRKADYSVSRLEKLKNRKLRNHHNLELYTDYLHLFEVTIVNMLAALSGDLEKIYMQSNDLRQEVYNIFVGRGKEYSKSNQYLDFWLKDFVLQHGIFGKYMQSSPDQLTREYKTILKEAAEDYLNDYELLNAFKHGLRIHASGKNSVSMQLDGSSTSHVIGEYGATIYYYSRKKGPTQHGEKTYIVSRCQISFHYQRVYQKIGYLTSSLENTRETLLHFTKQDSKRKRKHVCNTIKILDREKFYQHIGYFRICSPVYSYSVISKKNKK